MENHFCCSVQEYIYIFSFSKMQKDCSQEPITRSVQLPYSLCETAFSQVGLFLEKPFPRIGFQ